QPERDAKDGPEPGEEEKRDGQGEIKNGEAVDGGHAGAGEPRGPFAQRRDIRSIPTAGLCCARVQSKFTRSFSITSGNRRTYCRTRPIYSPTSPSAMSWSEAKKSVANRIGAMPAEKVFQKMSLAAR